MWKYPSKQKLNQSRRQKFIYLRIFIQDKKASVIIKSTVINDCPVKKARELLQLMLCASLQVAWNTLLKTVTESVFSKVSGLAMNGNGQIYHGFSSGVFLG